MLSGGIWSLSVCHQLEEYIRHEYFIICKNVITTSALSSEKGIQYKFVIVLEK
jgi:hypothetical protein